MQNPAQNKMLTPSQVEQAGNAARTMLRLARLPEHEGAVAELCRKLAEVAFRLAEQSIGDDERERLLKALATLKESLAEIGREVK